jgi:hypothetical protein
MARNPYISFSDSDEQNLYESLLIESLQFYGEDVYYIPRDVITNDEILNEAIESKFDDFIEIEMYLETVDAFEGDGEMFGRFGLEMRSQIKLMVSKLRFQEEINNTVGETRNIIRPREGDLIYHALTKGLYEIRYVDNETPSFYNLGNLPVFRLTCELFEYSGEEIETGIDSIDRFTEKFTTDGLQLSTDLELTKGATAVISSDDSPPFTAFAKILESSGNDLRLGDITFNSIYFAIESGLSIGDGTSTGVITDIYDTLSNASPVDPFEDSSQSGDNADLEDFGNLILDNSLNDPLGKVT